MANQTNPSRATLIASMVVGVLLICLGSCSGVVAIAGLAESELDELWIVGVLVGITALLFVGGVMLILFSRRGQLNGGDDTRLDDADEDEEERNRDTVISVEHIAGPSGSAAGGRGAAGGAGVAAGGYAGGSAGGAGVAAGGHAGGSAGAQGNAGGYAGGSAGGATSAAGVGFAAGAVAGSSSRAGMASGSSSPAGTPAGAGAPYADESAGHGSTSTGGTAYASAGSRPSAGDTAAADAPSAQDSAASRPIAMTSVPAAGPAPAANDAPASQPESKTEDIAGLVTRSDNLFATLKDLVHHERESAEAKSEHRHLASMLEASGLLDWQDAPVCTAARLTRNRHYWIRQNVDELSPADYDRLIGIEAALSLNQDVPEARRLERTDPATLLAMQALLRRMQDQRIEPYDLSQSLGIAYPDTDPEDTPGEWLLRARLVSAAECAVTPFRLVYELRSHVAAGIVALSLELPRPGCFRVLTTEELLVSEARAYALRLSALMARQAFAASPRVERVVVNCHEHGSAKTLLSIDFTRELLARLAPTLAGDEIDGSGFPADPAIRVSFGADGWFLPVRPVLALDDASVSPRERFCYPELDARAASERLREVTGARMVADLGINESAGRIAAWEELAEQPWDTTEQAVSRLVALRDKSPDITVMEACTRTTNALVSGAVDARDLDTVQNVFITGSALEAAVARAEKAIGEEGKEDPEAALAALSDALGAIEALGPYIDDENTVYRYFGSVSERICFNLSFDDHRRAVRLVPDAYYNALSNASIAHAMLGHADVAMRYAEEMMRVAPASIHAALRKVRLLENASRVYEAVDLIRGMLRYASTPRDAAICHYRLAYLEWKLGREDLGVACYQRSLAWDTEMSAQAREELDDLLSSNDKLRRLSDDEVFSLLAQEGIPLGCDASDRRRTAAAAALCCDEGVFWAARPLVGVLFGIEGDDVMMGIYRSLTREVY